MNSCWRSVVADILPILLRLMRSIKGYTYFCFCLKYKGKGVPLPCSQRGDGS